MNKKIVSTLSVGFALVVPALVVAQVARFSENEPLTVARMDQIVDAINGINYAAAVALPVVPGDEGGAPISRTYTARSSGMLLFVPGGSGFADMVATISTATADGNATIARSLQGNSLSVPMGAGQRIVLRFSNAEGDTPSMNVYFSSLTGGPAPTVSDGPSAAE
jgi:hypothetical protein